MRTSKYPKGFIQNGARIADTFIKSTYVAVSSQTSVFDFKKLLDKMEAILNMCYPDKVSKELENKIHILCDIWPINELYVKHYIVPTIRVQPCSFIR